MTIMSDVGTITAARETAATDINKFVAVGRVHFPTKNAGLPNLTTYLSPTYVKTFPNKDGWGNQWGFYIDQDWGGTVAAQQYAIVSGGKDGASQPTAEPGGATTNFDCDIVYSNGTFLQYPE